MAEETLSHYLWRTRYRDQEASAPENDITGSWQRVAQNVAAIEREGDLWRRRFLEILQGYRFLPAGRILAGAGTTRQVTLFNCFVMGLIDDSIPGIFEALKEGALTMQQGGGVGYDFSTLRPRGSRARSTGSVASGPVSFMHVWDAMCATVVSTGARRGAMMATLRCDHPDIEEFIAAKQKPNTLRHFNLSVMLTDAFMQAVKDDAPWTLVFPEGSVEEPASGQRVARVWSGGSAAVPCRVWRVIAARELWRRLCESAYDCAEPGVLFIDRINAANNLGYAENLSATNPCGEEPLPPYGACNLGCLNLTAFVERAFTQTARLDLKALAGATRVAARFLDNVIEVSRFPLFRQHEQVHRARRIGLGITGLADALVMLGLRYDSGAAREVAAQAMRAIRDAAYEASVQLAEERGPFPQFEADRYAERPFIRGLPTAIQAGIRRHGIRNSHLLAIAPAGTISLLADNVSSGIEPIFRLEGQRRVLDGEGGYRNFQVTSYAYAAWRARQEQPHELPDYFVDQAGISAHDHLLMQASLQPYVDGAISKTIALQSGVKREVVAEIFQTAYDLNLKGCTVFRHAARPGVLTETAADAHRPGDAHCCSTERESD